MSSPLAIAAVTAVLRDLLNNGMVDHDITGAIGNNVTVTALPPDVIKIDEVNGRTQLNLFLHQVVPNTGWRNMGLPSRDASGGRMDNPPLALDLHYLLTAYGAEELHAEILLGYGMHLLHEVPVLDRQAIRTATGGATIDVSTLPPAFQALSASDLADQVEQIKIVPMALQIEEMSKLWSALQAHYRPTAAYQVSVVLIEGTESVRSALPVLSRGPRDPLTGREAGIRAVPELLPPYPMLTSVTPPGNQPAARLGDIISLEGHRLNGTNIVARFEHGQLENPIELALPPNANSDRLNVTLPAAAPAPSEWPPGIWSVSVRMQPSGETELRTTNEVTMLLGPRLDLVGSSATRDAGTGAVTVQLAFSPEIRVGQQARLNIGGFESRPTSLAAQTGNLDFVFSELPAGTQWVRLRIDGADSLLVDRSVSPPQFDTTQQMVIPA